MQEFIFRSVLVLVAVFSIVIFGPLALDAVMSKNRCEKAVLSYAKAFENPSSSRAQLSELKVQYEGICKSMGVKAEVYTSMLNSKWVNN